jgi:hypothetical protein
MTTFWQARKTVAPLVWDDLRTPGHVVRTSGSSPPDVIGGFGGNASLYALQFDGGSTVEEVFIDIQLPHTWNQGTVIYPHVHFSPVSTNSNDAVSRAIRFVLEYTWASVNDSFGVISSYEMTAAFIPNASQWKHLIAAGEGGLDGAGKRISSILKCRLYRDPTHASDTYPQDVALNSFDIHFQVDSMGSTLEYTK